MRQNPAQRVAQVVVTRRSALRRMSAAGDERQCRQRQVHGTRSARPGDAVVGRRRSWLPWQVDNDDTARQLPLSSRQQVQLRARLSVARDENSNPIF